MAQKPLNEMAHRPGKMSEDAEYILSELKPIIQILENKVMDKSEIIQAISTMSAKIDALKDALREVSDKLDANAENVTGLDSDYRTSVDSKLS